MNNPCGPVPLLFITGFWARENDAAEPYPRRSGRAGKKIGVIINEWGPGQYRLELIRAKDIEIEELNDGQVFCSAFPAIFWRLLSCSPSALWMS